MRYMSILKKSGGIAYHRKTTDGSVLQGQLNHRQLSDPAPCAGSSQCHLYGIQEHQAAHKDQLSNGSDGFAKVGRSIQNSSVNVNMEVRLFLLRHPISDKS